MNTMFGQCKPKLLVALCKVLGKVADKFLAGANSEGLIKSDEEVSINIPAGARDGIQLNVRGKGKRRSFWWNTLEIY